MNNPEGPKYVHRWSTEDVEPSRQVDHDAAQASSTMIPLSMSVPSGPFEATVEHARLGPLDVLRLTGSTHQASREKHHVESGRAHNYYLMLNVSSQWSLTLDAQFPLPPGEAVLIDSTRPCEIRVQDYEIVSIALPAAWIRRWVRRPELLAGRSLSRSIAGRALAEMLRQLTPAFVAASPLPRHVVADQVGSLLALVEAELTGVEPLPNASRGWPGTSTSSERAHIASRMLQSRLFSAVPAAEIARRAGFSNVEEMVDALQSLAKGS